MDGTTKYGTKVTLAKELDGQQEVQVQQFFGADHCAKAVSFVQSKLKEFGNVMTFHFMEPIILTTKE